MKFHDGKMISIELLGSRGISIGLAEESGAAWRLLLEGVERMRSLEFMDGNIILDVVEFCGQEPPLDVLRKLYDLRTPEMPDYLNSIASKIRSSKMTLVHIVPSYGCELIAICEKVQAVRAS